MTVCRQERGTITLAIDEQSETPASVTNLTTLLASGFGVGLSPVAPGTVGSLLGIVCFYPLLGVSSAIQWSTFFVACAVAIASSERAGKAWGVIDHRAIVIDEVVGVWLAVLIPLSVLTFSVSLPLLAVGAFLAFRLYDIVKPWPVNVLERRLPGGWGVVMDDLAAGAMAGLILTLALLVIGPA